MHYVPTEQDFAVKVKDAVAGMNAWKSTVQKKAIHVVATVNRFSFSHFSLFDLIRYMRQESSLRKSFIIMTMNGSHQSDIYL